MILEYLSKIGLALLMSVLVGFEREQSKKPAGLRDIALVTIGATFFAILALELVTIAGNVRYDMGRIIAYTVVGIGFLGSGVIMQNKNKLEGITTASTLWAMVSTGLFCGLGLYELALISGLCVYIILKSKHIRITIAKTRKKRKKR